MNSESFFSGFCGSGNSLRVLVRTALRSSASLGIEVPRSSGSAWMKPRLRDSMFFAEHGQTVDG